MQPSRSALTRKLVNSYGISLGLRVEGSSIRSHARLGDLVSSLFSPTLIHCWRTVPTMGKRFTEREDAHLIRFLADPARIHADTTSSHLYKVLGPNSQLRWSRGRMPEAWHRRVCKISDLEGKVLREAKKMIKMSTEKATPIQLKDVRHEPVPASAPQKKKRPATSTATKNIATEIKSRRFTFDGVDISRAQSQSGDIKAIAKNTSEKTISNKKISNTVLPNKIEEAIPKKNSVESKNKVRAQKMAELAEVVDNIEALCNTARTLLSAVQVTKRKAEEAGDEAEAGRKGEARAGKRARATSQP
ncbi:hypothetical protein C8R43DRAFT_1007224 [Mycena crocata]|nr:hypothetical protein C8R43DRAFT_1007224 [Mycena crocata]